MRTLTRDPNRFAQELFDGLPSRYDTLAEVLSFGQNGRWRAEMVRHVLDARPATILDVATGTAGVALELAQRTGAQVTGIDLTPAMLGTGRHRIERAGASAQIRLVAGQAERLPFPDATFDALTFTYLLRYVARSRGDRARIGARRQTGRRDREPRVRGADQRVLAGVVVGIHALRAARGGLRHRRAGVVRGRPVPRAEHLRALPPLPRELDGRGVGRRRPARRLRAADEPRGRSRDVGEEARPVTTARPAFYAARPGGWRDWWTILHPPYTAWHLSYVVIGATLAPATDGGRLVATLLAFFLAVGVAAHALDEVHGRPLRTTVPTSTLAIVAVVALAGALALGVLGVTRAGPGLLVFMALGPLFVLGYNLELFGGVLHSDAGFAAAWGAFPVLTAYFVQADRLDATAALAAIAAFAFSLAQRSLSMQARMVRRRARVVEGTVVMHDGDVRPLDAHSLLGPIERALRWMACAEVALAIALVAARV